MKLIHIENVLILVNLILILYLVYVLSNRTIEKFYHDVPGLDPSAPDFEPHTHRDATPGPENEGCGDLCGSEGLSRPPIQCATSGQSCTSGDNCCGTAVCSGGTCQSSCSSNYYSNTDGICEVCPTYSANPPTGCTNCPAGSKRLPLTRQCIFCSYGTYRSETMTECGNCPDANQEPNANSGATACVDCPLGKYKSTDSMYCDTPCPEGQEANTNRDDCTPCPSGHVRAANSPDGCVQCPTGQKPNSDNSGCVACEDSDYDNWGECPDWQCGNTSRPVQIGNRKDRVSESCTLTREKNCTNACSTPSCPLGLSWDWVNSSASYQCCRPIGLGEPGTASDCGGPDDQEKRKYPCCGSQTCNLVRYRSPTGGGRGGPRHWEGHRCNDDDI